MRTIGVIGGMGPAATVDFFAKVVARTAAQADQDHVRLLIDNNPHVPDRSAAVADPTAPSPGVVLAQMARTLEAAGAEAIVMVCNTAHTWQADIEAAITVPFLSLIDLTAAATPGARVGLLATRGCIDAGLYQRAFAPREVLVTEGDACMRLLYRIKAGNVGPQARADMRALAQTLVDRGAEAIVAGCTEVPLVLDQADVAVPLISSTDVLVDRVIDFAGAQQVVEERGPSVRGAIFGELKAEIRK